MKKILALLMATLLIMTTFAACGENKNGGETATDANAGLYDMSSDTLTMGTNATFPPYEFTDDAGKVVGIDAEIAQAVATKLGKKLVIKDMDFDSLLTAVQGGACDIVFAGMTVTDERKEAVNFTQTYATGVQVVIVKDGSDIKTVDDLDGKKIGVQKGTTGDIYCTDDYGQENVKQYDNGALAIAALQNGQVDCVVIDNEPAKAFVAENEGLKILDTAYALEEYAASVSKDNPELYAAINGALEELIADGTVAAIVEKYIPAA